MATDSANAAMSTVAYFLSRCGVPTTGHPAPPQQLGVNSWERAYAMFYSQLGANRTLTRFRNALKSARDDFDAHLGSGRIGWRQKGSTSKESRPPRPLPKQKREVVQFWQHRSDEELWEIVHRYADLKVREVERSILADLAAEIDSAQPFAECRTEGGLKMMVSARIERDPALRSAAIRIHGTTCAVCGFSFADAYGEWGAGFAIVHHLVPLGDGDVGVRQTNPAADLAILCANCHCMVHRKYKVILTVEELQAKLIRSWPQSGEVDSSK